MEFAFFFAFLFSVVFVFYGGARLLVFKFIHRGKKPRPRFWPVRSDRADKYLSLALLALFVLGIGCFLEGFLIEPAFIEVTRHTLSSKKIAAGTGRLRIVHLSDFHSEPEGLNEVRAVEIVNGLDADLVLLTGDYINEDDAVPLVRRTLDAFKSSYGTFFVMGNQDLHFLPKGSLDGLKATVLDKEARLVDIRGTRVRVSGMEVDEQPYFDDFIKSVQGGPAYDIFLCHYTDLIYKAQKAGIDLYLAGHTHGGQVRLPFYGALLTLAKFGKRFEAGMYRVERTVLYVNRGLGMEGGAAPRVRFLCRPEITVLDVAPE